MLGGNLSSAPHAYEGRCWWVKIFLVYKKESCNYKVIVWGQIGV